MFHSSRIHMRCRRVLHLMFPTSNPKRKINVLSIRDLWLNLNYVYRKHEINLKNKSIINKKSGKTMKNYFHKIFLRSYQCFLYSTSVFLMVDFMYGKLYNRYCKENLSLFPILLNWNSNIKILHVLIKKKLKRKSKTCFFFSFLFFFWSFLIFKFCSIYSSIEGKLIFFFMTEIEAFWEYLKWKMEKWLYRFHIYLRQLPSLKVYHIYF